MVILSRRRFPSLTLCTSLIRRKSWPLWLCGIWLRYYFLPWSSYKNEQYKREKKRLSDCVKNPSATKITITITVLLIKSIPLLSSWTRTTYGTRIQQLLWLSTSHLIATLCPFSILKQQLNKPEQTYIRCFFQCNRRTVKAWVCASVLHFSMKQLTGQTKERNSCYG